MLYNLTDIRYLYWVNGKAYMNACMCAKHTSTYDTNILVRSSGHLHVYPDSDKV
jgi:hypothetical protein